MSKFKPGLRVCVIDADTSELRKGVIKSICYELEIAIVKFDDDNVEKVRFDCLGIEPETKVQEEKPTEPVEKSEITITPEAFRNVSMDTVLEMTKDNPIVGLALTLYTAKLHRALFFDAVDND